MTPWEKYVIALDVGGTKLEAALVSPEGKILEGSRSRRPTGPESTGITLRGAVNEAIQEALLALPDRADLIGVGIASAGPIDRTAGTITAVNMRAADGFPLVEVVEELCADIDEAGLSIYFGHDGGALALAESWLGATKSAKSSLSIVVSTGVGGGFVVDGKYIPGASGNAGHLGQTRREGGITLEEIASGPGSVRWARAQGWEGQTGEDIARDAAAGNPIARQAIERSAKAVGEALADASTLIDLEVVAIGGGFSRVSDDYVDLVQHALTASAVHGYSQRTRVVRSALSDEGPLIGAAAFLLRR